MVKFTKTFFPCLYKQERLRVFLMFFLFFGLSGFTTFDKLPEDEHLYIRQNTTLENVLDKIKDKFTVHFLYEDENVRQKEVKAASINLENSIENVLKVILDPLSLGYEKLNNDTFIIVKKKKEEAKIENLLPEKISIKQIEVTGKVKSMENNEPIIGASVMIKGTTIGTVTDVNGEFKLVVRDLSDVLVISFIGYQPKEQSVNNQTNFEIYLQENISMLGEVVVTALGFEEDGDRMGIATSKVSGTQVAQSGETSAITGMAGKASGVRITRSSGDPGAGAHIQIRGPATITSDLQPLIILDGVPISNDTRNTGNTTGVVSQSRLNDINPNDIESIQILKGASAAALWGSQAAKGVIVITTKQGQKGNKINVSFKSTQSVDKINFTHPLQSTFGQGDGGVFVGNSVRSWGDNISQRSGEPDVLRTNGPFFQAPDGTRLYGILQKNDRSVHLDDNFNQIFQTGRFAENNISLSGGNDQGNIFFSFSDLNQTGIIRSNSDYRRTTARFNAQRKFGNTVTVKSNTSYIKTSSNRIRLGASSTGLYLGMLRTPPDFNNGYYEGDYYANANAAPIPNRHRSYRNPIGSSLNAGFNNPNWTINNQKNQADMNRFISSFQVDVKPTQWLTLISRTGLDFYNEKIVEFFKPGTVGNTFQRGTFEEDIALNGILNTDLMAKASGQLTSKIGGSLLTGFNINDRSFSRIGGSIINFILPSDDLESFSNASPENSAISNFRRNQRTAALYFSGQLDYNDILFFNATTRIEKASTVGPEANNNFIYPSADVAWQFSSLDVLKNSPVLSFGKLRMSYGLVGVAPPPYNTQLNYVSPSYSDQWGGGLDLSIYGNGSFVPSVSLGDPGLRPEIKKEFEIGTDLRFFANKMRVGITHYQNKTEDAFFDLPIANTSGYDNIFTNAGSLQNKGWEVDASYLVLKKKNFAFSVDVNWHRYRNMVLDLRGVESINLGGLAGTSGRAIEGQPLGVFWGSRFERDDNNNIIFDQNGFPKMDNQSGVIGDPNPDWQGGLGLNFKYKNFTLYSLFETYQGADIYAGTKAVLVNYGNYQETANITTSNQNLREYNGNIIPINTSFRGNIHDFGAGPVALTESWYTGIGGFFNGVQENFVEDGSWTRLRELTLAYNLSNQALKKLTRLGSVQLSFTARNLFVWTKFVGNDPDTNLTGVSTTRGIEYFNNPGTKSYLFSLTVNY
jgi:TonB-linked SusC/RagA family outer membrane protein